MAIALWKQRPCQWNFTMNPCTLGTVLTLRWWRVKMFTAELSREARIHYIFQLFFVKCLEEVDSWEDLTDGDIQIAIQNDTGPRNALSILKVPFEVLVRRQISQLLDPSIQCASDSLEPKWTQWPNGLSMGLNPYIINQYAFLLKMCLFLCFL